MTVNMTSDVSRALPSSGGATTVEVTIDPVAKTTATTRHIALLIDTSGSMEGSKIENARRGAIEAIGKLDNDDYVSIIGFDSGVETVLPMSKWGKKDQQQIEQRIQSIVTGGGTDIYNGLETAHDQLLEKTPDSHHAVARIILLSDGQDRYEPSTYRDLAAEYDEDGISIMAAGVGWGYDEAVILALAKGSGGSPADLSEDDISEFLGETVSGTESVVEPNPTLEIVPEQGFVIDDEPAYIESPSSEERTITSSESGGAVSLPELRVGEPHRLTFEILGQPKSAGITHDLADLSVVDSSGTELATSSVSVEYTSEGGIEKVSVEKRRTSAKVTTDIQDPNISQSEVKEAIDKVRERGWDDTAADLEKKLDTADEKGGIIRLDEGSINRSEE